MLDSLKKQISVAVAYPDLLPGAISSRLGLDRRSSYIFEHVDRLLREIEADETVTTRAAAVAGLRQLGLDDFAYMFWSMPHPQYPKLSGLLPSMASADVQRQWTGRSGVALLLQTVAFVRSVAFQYVRLTGKPFHEVDMLDYGCGYGRIVRVMQYFTGEERIIGLDPWSESIRLCKQVMLPSNFLLSEYLPEDLPVGERRFDLIYAYSVFTHTSLKATLAALAAIRKYIRDTGVLVVTVRPIEYWQFARHIPTKVSTQLEREHRSNGFAFRPHTGPGSNEYGDTSFSLEWLARNCPDWKIRLVDRSLEDRMQLYVFLTPA